MREVSHIIYIMDLVFINLKMEIIMKVILKIIYIMAGENLFIVMVMFMKENLKMI